MTWKPELQKSMENLKLNDIVFYDVQGLSPLTDMFVVASADSITQLEAARNQAQRIMKNNKLTLKNPTEDWSGGWLIMDYDEVIINIFLEEKRSFYNLDDFIKAGKINLDEIKNAVER